MKIESDMSTMKNLTYLIRSIDFSKIDICPHSSIRNILSGSGIITQWSDRCIFGATF